MLYGLTYLYRSSDFFEIVEKFQPDAVSFTACWLRLKGKESFSDYYEFAFMGAFGMGYKLLVLGQTRIEKMEWDDILECENRDLWKTAEIVKQAALKVWRSKQSGEQRDRTRRDLVIRAGVLVGIEPVEVALVDWDAFLKDKIPEKVPVVVNLSD